MTNADQPTLFNQPTEAGTSEPAPDMAEVAARIAANAGNRDYEDRTSEAAADQGWGPVTLPEGVASLDERRAQVVARRHPSSPSFVPKPMRESRHGDSELDGGQTPDYHEPYEPVPPEAKAMGKLGLAFARSEIRHSKERAERQD